MNNKTYEELRIEFIPLEGTNFEISKKVLFKGISIKQLTKLKRKDEILVLQYDDDKNYNRQIISGLNFIENNKKMGLGVIDLRGLHGKM
jgi:tRNA-binding EMAP/Myf-like protein